jgi:subtilase family serine protease
MQVSGLFTAGSAQGGAAGAVPVGNTLSAALSSLANSLNSAGGTSLMTALQSAASTPAQSVAADAGGVATPFAKAHAVAAPDRAHPDAANGAAPFSPAQISQAYGLNLISNTGAGQTIYIVDAYNDPNIASDLATFDSQWGLAAANLTVHKMSSRISNNSSWGVEESLDVEWAHAIAPQANIVLVEATSSSNANLFAAVNYATTSGAKIVSMSWGGSDSSSDSSYDSYFEHSGVTYLASAGDTASAIEYPAASPYVLSVGGTSLTLTTSNGYSSESAWADSGGGISTHESRPGYQTSYGITNSGRSIPDVAWDADPNTGVYVYDSYVRGGGGWYEVGGTSVGAPSWAGVVALADQTRSTPLSTDNLASRTEYNAATGSVYASNYHDITTGSNGHAAGTGYDLVTGVGTPQGNNLVPWLVSNS